MVVNAYSRTQAKFWYVDFTIKSHADRCDLQLPVRRGAVKSVNHVMNLQDLFRQLFNHPSTHIFRPLAATTLTLQNPHAQSLRFRS
jgi:hypothetical protein